MILAIFSALIGGIVCEETEPFVDARVDTRSKWNLIVKYTVGVFFIYPFFEWMLRVLMGSLGGDSFTKEQKERVSILTRISYFLAALGIGTGVVFDHMIKS